MGCLRGLKYGVTLNYVMGLNFFAAPGEMVKTGSRTVKCVTGYNLTGLLVGSEGTLGVISEIILKLIPLPSARKAMLATFGNVAQASETVAAIIANPIVPATLEFMDNFTIRAVEDYSQAGLPVTAAALLAIVVLEDATVPRSQIPAMIQTIEAISRRFDLPIGTFGHAGDGNLYPTILTDRRHQSEWHRVEAAVDAIFEAALRFGGALSGEHGIAAAKSRFMEKEVARGTILYSKRIKHALDPKNILNPGKSIGELSAVST
jgi:glycolate oxidase